MIDVHSHIIPNVDDGAHSIEETVAMLAEAKEAGFTDIVLTSHYIADYYNTEASITKIWMEQLQSIADKENINVKLYSGNEVYITDEVDKLIKNGVVCTLANSRYVLIELPMTSNIKYLYDIIFILNAINIVPVIAHPERYSCIQEDIDKIEDLIEQGCLIQCNYGSIIGIYGKEAQKTVKQLFKRNFVHLLGSDCHRPKTIYKEMNYIMKELKKIISDAKIYEITVENPSMILRNEKI